VGRAHPLFLRLAGRRVVVVGGGPVAVDKVKALLAAGAEVEVVAPAIEPALLALAVCCRPRAFQPADLDGAWLVYAAAPPAVNALVRAAADARQLFCVAVDDPERCSALGAARLDRGGIAIALSSDGSAPALVALLRQLLEASLPEDLGRWRQLAGALRAEQRRAGTPLHARKRLLIERLRALSEGMEP
jgi:siroheme synthase-like protein